MKLKPKKKSLLLKNLKENKKNVADQTIKESELPINNNQSTTTNQQQPIKNNQSEF